MHDRLKEVLHRETRADERSDAASIQRTLPRLARALSLNIARNLELPQMIETQHSHTDAIKPADAPANIHVLLIDDNEDDAMIAQDHLSRIPGRRYHAKWASTFQEGLATLLEQKHHICFVDYCLDQGTGLAILAEAVKLACPTPIIMISGTTDTNLCKDAIELGAVDFLFKSEVNSYALERAIDQALDK